MKNFRLVTFVVGLVSFLMIAGGWCQTKRESPSAAAPDYVISPGDIISLNTLNDPKGTDTLRVSRKGFIEHPYMGPVKIASLTESQAARVLENALRGDYLINPKVRITVLTYAKISFAVLGAVNNPGTFEAPANKRITLMHAIARAGDFNDVASRKKVMVRRVTDGQARTVTVNVDALLNDPNLSPFYIQDDDTIEVKESLF